MRFLAASLVLAALAQATQLPERRGYPVDCRNDPLVGVFSKIPGVASFCP
jgi:hypothetical protein